VNAPGGVLVTVGVADLSQDAARIADGEAVCRDIFRDDAARADNAIVTNADAGQDNNIAAKPDVVADGYRRGVFPSLVAQDGVQRVIDGVEGDVGGKEDVVADVPPFAGVGAAAVDAAESPLSETGEVTALQTHGADYAEIAWQRRLRYQTGKKKKRGREI